MDYHDDNFAIVFAAMGVRGRAGGELWKLWAGSLVSLGPRHGPICRGVGHTPRREAVSIWAFRWERQESDWRGAVGSVTRAMCPSGHPKGRAGYKVSPQGNVGRQDSLGRQMQMPGGGGGSRWPRRQDGTEQSSPWRSLTSDETLPRMGSEPALPSQPQGHPVTVRQSVPGFTEKRREGPGPPSGRRAAPSPSHCVSR